MSKPRGMAEVIERNAVGPGLFRLHTLKKDLPYTRSTFYMKSAVLVKKNLAERFKIEFKKKK